MVATSGCARSALTITTNFQLGDVQSVMWVLPNLRPWKRSGSQAGIDDRAWPMGREKEATDAHIPSQKHRNKQWWWENRNHHKGLPPPDWGPPEWFELREDYWYCKLCDQRADDDGSHVRSRGHTRRASWPTGPLALPAVAPVFAAPEALWGPCPPSQGSRPTFKALPPVPA